jgi:hypothetical protein
MACVELVVDAANVIGSRPDGWWRDRPGAAARLVSALAAALRSGALTSPVVVVLEGAARAGAPAGEFPVAVDGAGSAAGGPADSAAGGTPADPAGTAAADGPADSAAGGTPADPAGTAAADGPADSAAGGTPADPAATAAADGPADSAAGGPALRVVHASRDGDSAIVDEVAALVAAGGSPTVVTADRGLRDRVLAAGGAVVGPTWLLDRL